MIKLKELIKSVIKEMDLTPDDLKKFNKIMRGGVKIPGSIHSKDTNEVDYQKVGFGYGGNGFGGNSTGPDRTYRSDKGAVGGKRVPTRP